MAAKSIAALAQSYFYGPWTCGVFSALQSAGAAGVGLGTAKAGAAAGGAVPIAKRVKAAFTR